MKRVEYTDSVPVVSSALQHVWYNRETEELYVQFKRGNIAGYSNVPLSTFTALTESYSVGSYYSLSVKDNYPGISGDVQFVKKDEPAPAKVATGSRVEVTVEITGTLKFSSKPGVRADHLLVEVHKYLDEILVDGTYKVRQVIQNFDD